MNYQVVILNEVIKNYLLVKGLCYVQNDNTDVVFKLLFYCVKLKKNILCR